jgi:hypothetical protein
MSAKQPEKSVEKLRRLAKREPRAVLGVLAHWIQQGNKVKPRSG